MSAVVAPLFTAERDGRRLRAFAAEGTAPELPWFALADIAAALATDREEEVEALAGLGAGGLGVRLRSAVTADGMVVLTDQPSTFRLLATVQAAQGDLSTLPAAWAMFRDADLGGVMAMVRSMPPEEGRRWIRVAHETSAAALHADLKRMTETAADGHGHG